MDRCTMSKLNMRRLIFLILNQLLIYSKIEAMAGRFAQRLIKPALVIGNGMGTTYLMQGNHTVYARSNRDQAYHDAINQAGYTAAEIPNEEILKMLVLEKRLHIANQIAPKDIEQENQKTKIE